MAMSSYKAQRSQDVVVPVIDGCKTAWSTKYFWRVEDLPEIYEQLNHRLNALDALEHEVRRLYLPDMQEPVLLEYIDAVRRIPKGLGNKIDTFNLQMEKQPSLDAGKLFESYCHQNQHEFDVLQHLVLVGTNDIAQGLLGYIALNNEEGKKTSQDLRKEAVDKAKDWIRHLDAGKQIEDKSAMAISHGHWAVLEVAGTHLEVGDYDIRSQTVIGVPTGHPKTWRFMQDQRFQKLVDYSREMHYKVEHGELNFLKAFRRNGRNITALDKLCGPDMSVIAFKEDINRVFSEIDAIEMELKNMKPNPLYDLS